MNGTYAGSSSPRASSSTPAAISWSLTLGVVVHDVDERTKPIPVLSAPAQLANRAVHTAEARALDQHGLGVRHRVQDSPVQPRADRWLRHAEILRGFGYR